MPQVITTGQIPQMVIAAAQKYGVPPNLALEVALTESGFNQAAVSPAGAIGVMQLMPATAASLGVDPTNAAANIDGGVRYLASLLSRYGGDTAKALAAYNWGPGNVDNAVSANGAGWLSTAPTETQNYVTGIMSSIGQNYTLSVTPASVASGAAAAVTGAVGDAVDNTSPGTLLLLTAFAIGAYFLSDILLPDD